MYVKKQVASFFLGFLSVSDYKARELKTKMYKTTKEYGNDLSKRRKQDYDEESVISSVRVYSNIQAHLDMLYKKLCANGDYDHCVAHALNLILNNVAKTGS